MPHIQTAISVERKMALQMLILKQTNNTTATDIDQLVRALPEPLKHGVKQELQSAGSMSLEELKAEYGPF